jgi:prepilin-type N-terminal cleavage/methylation domain-containing protein
MKSRPDDEGFTLIEVLIAMIVLGIGVAALMTAFGMQAKTSLTNRNQAASESLLTAAAEWVKGLSFTNNGLTCNAISGTVPPDKVAYDTTKFNVTYGPGTAIGSDSMCSIQQVPVTVTALNASNGFTLTVTVVKRPSIEPTP